MSRVKIDDAVGGIQSFTITEFKERAREVIELVTERRAVAISRHSVPQVVLISALDYAEFVTLRRERLNFLTQRYDQMVARMQTPEAAAGVDALFNATPEELGRAAIAAAKRV